MGESLVVVNVIRSDNSKNNAEFGLDCRAYKYISRSTSEVARLISEEIYSELSEELIHFHALKGMPVFHIIEESTGIYVESPYIDMINDTPEYRSLFEALVNCVKRDYKAFSSGKSAGREAVRPLTVSA